MFIVHTFRNWKLIKSTIQKFINWEKLREKFFHRFSITRVHANEWTTNEWKLTSVEAEQCRQCLYHWSSLSHFFFFFRTRELSSALFTIRKIPSYCVGNPTDNWSELHMCHTTTPSRVKSLAAFNQLIIIAFNELFGRYFLLLPL